MKKVAVLLTHPTQYHAPWFRALAERPEVKIHVYYCFRLADAKQGTGFGIEFEWDIPLLDGYPNSFLENISKSPGWHFSGSDTPELIPLIESHQYDAWIINGWTTKSEWQCIRACWRTDTPMLIRGDSSLLTPRPLHIRVAKRLLLGMWIPRFTKYLTVGRLNEEYYLHYGADRSRFVPVRHFVDNDWFAERAADERKRKSEARTGSDIRDHTTVFLFAGKLIGKKQPMDAFAAIQSLRDEGLDVHLRVAGDGPLREALEEYVSSWNLPVTFLGFQNQSQMPAAYASADVLVLPSVSDETWGLVVNEAMACSLPAIVSDRVGCAPDLILEGETGATYPAGNVHALTATMRQYATNPNVAADQGAKARIHIEAYSLVGATDHTITAVMTSAPRLKQAS